MGVVRRAWGVTVALGCACWPYVCSAVCSAKLGEMACDVGMVNGMLGEVLAGCVQGRGLMVVKRRAGHLGKLFADSWRCSWVSGNGHAG